MIEQYKELIWFFAGVFAYRTLVMLFTYGHMSQFVQGVTDQTLKMMGTAAEDIGFIRETKYKTMSEAGHTDDAIDTIRTIDERVFNGWKSVCVSHMLVNYPQPYKRSLKFEDWEGAMAELDRLYKYESKRKKS
tara:strand:- start:207 stop:605 length:399 start_codon:yes stop_codon:yes gene_type:complete